MGGQQCNKPRDDHRFDQIIEKMLASRNPLRRRRGVELVDERKRSGICGLLRRWSNGNEYSWKLSSTEIAEVWAATLAAIFERSERGWHKKSPTHSRLTQTKGTFNGLIRKVARNKAVDRVRNRCKTIPYQYEDADQRAKMWRHEKAHEELFKKWRKRMRKRVKKLSKTEKPVFFHYLELYYANGGKAPATEELKAACNTDGSQALTTFAVKSALGRAMRKLRGDEDGEGGPQCDGDGEGGPQCDDDGEGGPQ